MKRASIEFLKANSPIREHVTKFGGQPVWLESPQWPLSRSTFNPMRFVGQIALDRDLFGEVAGQMAYFFMTDEEDYVDGTWEPDGGENAIIVQPGRLLVPVRDLEIGPTLYRMVPQSGKQRLVQESCEFAVRLTWGDDPEFLSEDELWDRDKEQSSSYRTSLEGNKIGGTPGFLQGDQFPGDGYRRLLLQLDSTNVPFSINFGDAGIGYAFLSGDGSSGKFLWQCC